MIADAMTVKARLNIHHERAYDYDETTKLWKYRPVDEDEEVPNIVTNAGRRIIHTYVYGNTIQRLTANLGSGFRYIAVSNDSSTPDAADVSLAGEISGNGLSRGVGTVTLPTGSGTISTIQRLFTFTGGSQGVRKAALFDVGDAGNMAHEVIFSQRVLETNDTVTLTYSITLT